MKKLFLLAAAALTCLSVLAETATINPTFEGNYRTNNAVPTGWTKVTTTDAQFEVYNGARFFAVQTWQIANISKVDSLEFVYTRVAGQTNNGDVSMWAFPYNSMVTSSADYNTLGVAFLNDVQTVLGVMPGNTITNAPMATSESVDADGVHSRVIRLGAAAINSLKAAGTIAGDYLTVNILLNTLNSTNNYKYYHTATETMPASYCTVHYTGEVETPAILNNTTKTGYSDLRAAVTEATAGDVLIINEDITISGSRLEIQKALTLQGATGAERLICDVPANQLMILANDNTEAYQVTFKNLVIDGQSTTRATQTIDSNNKATLVFDGVSIVNTDYSVATADIKSNGGNVVLKGHNVFAQGIYLNKNKRIDGKDATHTAANPIRIMLAGDYAEDYCVVLNCNDSTLYTAVDAAATTGWVLYVSNGKELKGRKVALDPTAVADLQATEPKALKLLQDGRIVIRRGDDIYDLTGKKF